MMKLFIYPVPAKWDELYERPIEDSASKKKTVNTILELVKKQGDKALINLSEKFDKVSVKSLKLDKATVKKAKKAVSSDLKRAIGEAYKNIYKFHFAQHNNKIEKIETTPGVVCWRKNVPIEKVGLYIPGGSAPLFSTVLMLGIPAQIAGCKEVILCSPPHIHPAILYTADLCGIKNIFSVGGAQAIIAMAYGTKTIPKIDKIFGPGNSFVTIAKQLVAQDGVAIDMPAGPSEVLIIADDTANPVFVAADLLSQAEHGEDSQVMLVSTSKKLVDMVNAELKTQLTMIPRKAIAQKSLNKSRAVLVKSVDEALFFSNNYAPEHLIVCCKNAEVVANKVINAGSVFIGNYSPESAGDYASGTNHTLPTNGYARAYGGITVDSFIKKITFQQLNKNGLERLGSTIEIMAEAEKLIAHKNAVSLRLKGGHNV